MLTTAIILTCTASVLLIAFPGVAESAVVTSLEFTVERVIPSLFCFMVISKFALSIDASRILKPLFRPLSKLLHLSNEEAGCFITGNLCGFPAGAAMCSDIIGEMGYKGIRAVTLVSLSNNISIGFMTSFVGVGIFGSMSAGVILWLCQFASAVIVNAVIRKRIVVKESDKRKRETEIQLPSALVASVKDGALSALYLTGFIVTFSVITAYIDMFISKLSLPPSVYAVVSSLLEVSHGCVASSALGEPYSFILIAFSSAFSGLCVIFQSAVFFVPCGIRIRDYTALKIAQGALCAVLSALLYRLFM